MRVAREAELDAQRRGPRKGIGVMRQQDVGDVLPDEGFEAAQHRGRFVRAWASALIVDPDQIEAAVAPGQFYTLLPQHMHAVTLKERLRPCLHPCRALVVAMAPPDA